MPTRESLVKNLSGTSEKLNGKNYLLWAQSFETFIAVYRKMSHLTKPSPNSKDAIYNDWFADDATIISVLINSMEFTVARGVMMLRPTKKMWTPCVSCMVTRRTYLESLKSTSSCSPYDKVIGLFRSILHCCRLYLMSLRFINL